MPKPRRFRSARIHPLVHTITTESGRKYRIWNPETYTYLTPELSEEEMHVQLLCHRLSQMMSRGSETPLFLLDVTVSGWRTSENREQGVIEMGSDPPVFNLPSDDAGRAANVAAVAIHAYREYVKRGGDPSKLPLMSFHGGVFEIFLVDENGES